MNFDTAEDKTVPFLLRTDSSLRRVSLGACAKVNVRQRAVEQKLVLTDSRSVAHAAVPLVYSSH